MKQLITDILKRLGEAPMPENYPRLRKNDRLFEYVDWGQCDSTNALVDINSAVYEESEGNFVQTGNIGKRSETKAQKKGVHFLGHPLVYFQNTIWNFLL